MDERKERGHFAPHAPFLATQAEIPDSGNLQMWLEVNGVFRQKSSTANVIFDVPTLVSYVGQFMTLLTGDVISTGTPAGVGLGINRFSAQYLKAGDVVELGIEKLGQSGSWSSIFRKNNTIPALSNVRRDFLPFV